MKRKQAPAALQGPKTKKQKTLANVPASKSILSFFKAPPSPATPKIERSTAEIVDLTCSDDVDVLATPVKQEEIFSQDANSQTPTTSESQQTQSDSQQQVPATPESATLQSPQGNNKPFVKHYYLNNFSQIVGTVAEKDAHLFHANEKQLIESFGKDLCEQCQRLFIRIYNRKGPWFPIRELKAKYSKELELSAELQLSSQSTQEDVVVIDENEKLSAASFDEYMMQLSDRGYLEMFQPDTHKVDAELLNKLSTDDLKKLFGKYRINAKPPQRKPEIIEHILNDKYVQEKQAQNKQHSIHLFIKKAASSEKSPEEQEKSAQGKNKYLYKLVQNQVNSEFLRITPVASTLFKRIHRLYFLSNSAEDASLMIMETLQIVKYPQYEYKASSMFDSREELDMYEGALELQSQLESDMPLENAIPLLDMALHGMCDQKSKYKRLATKPDAYKLRFTPGWIFARCVHLGVDMYETSKMYEKATFFLNDLLDGPFCVGRRGKWWNRLALDLQHMGQNKQALATCKQALEDMSMRLADRLTLEKRLERLHKSTKTWKSDKTASRELKVAKDIYIRGHYPPFHLQKKSTKSLFLSYDGENSVHVEQLAMEYYKLQYSLDGLHTEGSIFGTLFGLLFWDIIFDSSVPHVFQTKYQQGPLDLHTDAFYSSRKATIDKRLADLRASKEYMLNLLTDMYSKHKDTTCACVNWRSFDDLSILQDVAYCLGNSVIAQICQVFCEDYTTRSGMPDLVIFRKGSYAEYKNTDSNAAKSVHTTTSELMGLLCEVKGPRDRLSDKQHIWIDVLLGAGAAVEICHIVEFDKSKSFKQAFADDEVFDPDLIN